MITYAELQSSLDVSEHSDCADYCLVGYDVLQFYKLELRVWNEISALTLRASEELNSNFL
jgi:hypothetical protein